MTLLIADPSCFFSECLPKTKGLSVNAIVSCLYVFKLLFEFPIDSKKAVPEIIGCKTLEGDALEAFLNWLEENRRCSATTHNQRLVALRSFARYVL